MAEATMTDIVDQVVTLLRAALAIPVEKYTPWAPPLEDRAFVNDGAEDGEEPRNLTGDASGGVWWTRKHIMVSVQVLWDETNTARETLRSYVETVKDTVKSNRDLTIAGKDTPSIGVVEGVSEPMSMQYRDDPITVCQITVSASWLC